MKKIVKYRLNADGTVPSFVEKGGMYAVNDNAEASPRDNAMLGISVDYPTGDFTIMSNDDVKRHLGGIGVPNPQLEAERIIDMLAAANGASTICNADCPVDTTFQSQIPSYADTATSFLEGKGETVNNITYVLTVYNATTQQELGHHFSNGHHMVKMSDANTVIEWYEQEVEVDGVVYSWVARNLNSGNVIETYKKTDIGWSKTVEGSEADPVVTVDGDYFTIPADKKHIIDHVNYKNRIIHWSDKETGFIIEYVKNV